MRYYITKIDELGVGPTLESDPNRAYEIYAVVDLVSEDGKKEIKNYEVTLGHTNAKMGEHLEELDEKYNFTDMADVLLTLYEHNHGGKIFFGRQVLAEIARKVIDAAESRAKGHMSEGLGKMM